MHGLWQIRRYIHDLLYFRRPDNILSLDQCVTCLKSSKSTNHLCLHCPPTLELWHRLFCIGNVKCVSTRGIVEMLGISFKGFSSLSKGKTLWQVAVLLSFIWFLCLERNARIFANRLRSREAI